jgi:hypothetical protein
MRGKREIPRLESGTEWQLDRESPGNGSASQQRENGFFRLLLQRCRDLREGSPWQVNQIEFLNGSTMVGHLTRIHSYL